MFCFMLTVLCSNISINIIIFQTDVAVRQQMQKTEVHKASARPVKLHVPVKWSVKVPVQWPVDLHAELLVKLPVHRNVCTSHGGYKRRQGCLSCL